MAHITLVQLNDLHGYLDPHPELFELTPGATCRSGGGVARIASLLRAIRHETGGEVVASTTAIRSTAPWPQSRRKAPPSSAR